MPPFRLDLTVAVLRRFSTNIVDVLAPDGRYVRALAGAPVPAIVSVRQVDATQIAVSAQGLPGDEERAVALARRMLGTDRASPGFDRAAATIPWLGGLAARMRGVKSPRYATLWEACVNSVVYQQISLYAAGAILRRVILALGAPIEHAGLLLHAFPTPAEFLAASDDALGTAGLTRNKMATLQRVARRLLDGTLDEAMLELRSTPEASALLCEIKGIGPWTAAVILLRGIGRLDLFPENDSGVARNIKALAGDDVDVADVLARLGDERGMLYYHLLLARLEALGEV